MPQLNPDDPNAPKWTKMPDVQRLRQAFVLDEDRTRDFWDWLGSGDGSAFERLSKVTRGAHRQAPYLWDALRLTPLPQDKVQDAHRDRIFALAASAFPKMPALLKWVFASPALGRQVAFARWMEAKSAEMTTPYPLARGNQHAQILVQLTANLVNLESESPDQAPVARKALFGALKKKKSTSTAWELLEALGAQEQSIELTGGRTKKVRYVRRLQEIVAYTQGAPNSTKRSTVKLKALASEHAAESFAAELLADAPPKPKKPRSTGPKLRKSDKLVEGRGMVSIWIDTILDPRGTLDGKGGPVGWFDHDHWERTSGDIASGIRCFSKSESFADAAITALSDLGAPTRGEVDVLYEVQVDTPPGQRAYGWFLGSFRYKELPKALPAGLPFTDIEDEVRTVRLTAGLHIEDQPDGWFELKLWDGEWVWSYGKRVGKEHFPKTRSRPRASFAECLEDAVAGLQGNTLTSDTPEVMLYLGNPDRTPADVRTAADALIRETRAALGGSDTSGRPQ